MINDGKIHLKVILNQVCKNTECLYEFFIKNAIATGYHRVHLSILGNSFAAFSFKNSYTTITQSPKSYKVRMSITTDMAIKYDSFKLIGKYK